MIDESLLDTPDALVRADSHGLLRAVAAGGAHVRTAARSAEESGLGQLAPEGRPGTVLVAGGGPESALIADLLGALAGDGVRVARLHPAGALAAPGALTWSLPRWAGPLDLLLIATADGSEPGLGMLLESAYRRGCTAVTVSPAGSPLAEVTRHRRSMALPFTPAPFQDTTGHPAAPGPVWALLTPLLLLGGRLGLFAADDADVSAMADRLDAVAERCGPTTRTHANAAKALAAEFAAALPLLWSEGPVAGAVARHATAVLTALPGRPALTAELPGAMTAHAALLNGALAPGTDTDDFFRDRVEEPAPLHPRVVLLRSASAQPGEGAAAAARDLAFEHGVTFSELDAAEDSGPLQTAAELISQLDFAAVYLALASGARP
ncbi:SIS domain-containing protein [Streptomyces litchfieldiae]|uniref:SIS domain-containing protein n=1 Tax=Streptomyces litchfieldiae TaxID=3075543 RepID=A0ABU2N0D5_9ACTN|nr:SIS domain-containing protein [Streptomyces sp. DSM 44938]MDT0346784.1 SIS domain-containing protein [Streptomyces sp. DSM 44938]